MPGKAGTAGFQFSLALREWPAATLVAKGCPATRQTLEVVVGVAGTCGAGEELAAAGGSTEAVEAGHSFLDRVVFNFQTHFLIQSTEESFKERCRLVRLGFNQSKMHSDFSPYIH